MSVRTIPVLLAALLLAAGCPASGDWDDDSMDDDADSDDDVADDDTLPPEDEREFLTTEPTATDRHVFVANPGRDTVSRIDVATRLVDSIDVGEEPTRVVVSSDFARAVVLNAGSDTVSVIDTATLGVAELPVREDFNHVEISPGGRWAVAWFNAAVEDADFDVEGVRSFTEVSFVDTLAQEVHSFSVGYNPRQVVFVQDDLLAVVVSDQALTAVDLSTDPVTPRPVDLGVDLEDPPTAAEVVVTPEGRWTFVRFEDLDEIVAVDLATGELGRLSGGSGPTDLDLGASGLRLYVVSRGSSEVRVFDAADPLSVPPEILPTPPTSTLGSLVLVPGGHLGLLFTTAALEDRFTSWDMDTGEMVERALVKPVRALAASPDGRSALVVHTQQDEPGSDDLFTGVEALTVIDLDGWISNPVGLEDRPLRWCTSGDGRYSMFIMEGNRNVGIVDHLTRLVDDVTVPSLPVFLGMLPLPGGPEQDLGWVSQEHDLGRISFVRPSDLSVQTVTGFELNGGID